MRRNPLLRLAAMTPLLLGLASLAHAQTVPPPQPLLVEKIPTGFVIAPDFKATDVRVADDFFVFEPQANVAINLTQRIAVTGAAGYRAVAATDALGEVLDGPTINLGLQFGW
jgi:hypothetical protein